MANYLDLSIDQNAFEEYENAFGAFHDTNLGSWIAGLFWLDWKNSPHRDSDRILLSPGCLLRYGVDSLEVQEELIATAINALREADEDDPRTAGLYELVSSRPFPAKLASDLAQPEFMRNKVFDVIVMTPKEALATRHEMVTVHRDGIIIELAA